MRASGRLSAEVGHTGADLMIAATALHHGAVVVTDNVSDFALPGKGGATPGGAGLQFDTLNLMQCSSGEIYNEQMVTLLMDKSWSF